MDRVRLIILSLIVLLGFLLRTYKLSAIPNGFFCDEAATGYNAYSILKTGKDEFGKILPVWFYSFGNNRLPLPIYMAVPFVGIFGLSEFSSRLASAFYGTLTIPLLLYLLYLLFPKIKAVAYFGALFLAIAPWHVHFARTAHEYIHLPFFLIAALVFFFMSVKRKRVLFLYLSFVNFALAFYTYYPSYLMVPMVMGLCLFLYFREYISFKKHAIFALLVFLVVSIPLIAGFYDGRALTRWNGGNVTILSKYKTLVEISKKVTYSYLLHFSPVFLFTKGDIDFPGQFVTRHSVRGMGMLYLFEAPLIIFALIYLLKKRSKEALLVFGILLIHPFSNAVTSTVYPYAPRSILGSVAWPMVSALGAAYIFSLSKRFRVIFLVIFALVISLSLGVYLKKYYYEYPIYSSDFWGWQAGPRDIMKIFLQQKDSYDEMLIYGDFNAPNIFVKFYDPTNKCQNKCKIVDPGFYDPAKRQLFAVSKEKLAEVPPHLTFAEKWVLYYPNNVPSFYIGELREKK